MPSSLSVGARKARWKPRSAKLGVATEYPEIVGGRAQIDVASLQPERDILFVDGDLEGAVLRSRSIPASRLPPVPVIGLVGVEAPSRLKALVNLGATSFLRKPVHGGAVYTSLFMGINQFLLRSDMYERVQALEERRRGRRAVHPRGHPVDAAERARRGVRLFPAPPRQACAHGRTSNSIARSF